MPSQDSLFPQELRHSLDAANLSPHRRALGYHWLNSGLAAEASGKIALSGHCRLRLDQALQVQSSEANAGPAENSWTLWDKAFTQKGLKQTQALVEKHGARLTPMERRTYARQLEKIEMGRAGFWAIRRAIGARLLRSRLNALRPPPLKAQLPPYAADLPVGPYNHRKTLESALRLLEGVDPGWTRDFLRIYTEGLAAIGNLTSASSAPAKSEKAEKPEKAEKTGNRTIRLV